MNINIQNHNIQTQNREVHNDSQMLSIDHTKINATKSAGKDMAVNFSSGDKNNSTYGVQELKTFDDIKSKAAIKDVDLENNAMAIMSNTMSGEDYQKVLEDGFSPEDMSADEIVTNLDKIKATMAASGAVIPGYTDDLSTEEIAKITGSLGYAMSIETSLKENQIPINKENVESINDALKLSEMTLEPSEEAKKYMVSNGLEPSVNNIYLANHSSANYENSNQASYYKDENGYVGKNPTELNFDELRPQIEKIVLDSGLIADEETMSQAEWLVKRNLPVTKENLVNLKEIDSVSFPLNTEDVVNASTVALADGKEVKDANLANQETIVSKAANAIRNLRQLEETRLMMTEEASIALLKKGIEIDTKDLKALVDDLKRAERDYFEPFLMEEKKENLPSEKISAYEDELTSKLDIFKQTSKAVDEINEAPENLAAIIAARKLAVEPSVSFISDLTKVDGSDNTTLSDVANLAVSLRSEYEKAGKSYETMMTSVRRDLGDSIKKAFRNVDDILEDLDMEVNKANEKAVRTLGYAGIEINENNIDTAIKANTALENIITHMTPARTLRMIRDGENPLDNDIFELSDKLFSEDEELDNMKYSEFLYKLEKTGGITDDEKTAFIGMYRLFNKIEKSDGKLVGDVIKADEKMTLSNIISASRSDRQIGSDIKIDDSFGVLEKLITSGTSITDQILSGFRNKEVDLDYAKYEAESIKEMVTKEEAVLKVLENVDEPVSPINMAAVNALINSRGSLFIGLKDKLDSDEERKLRDNVIDLQESFEDEESVEKAYKTFTQKTSDILKDKQENADNYIDFRSIKLLNKQLSIVSKLSDIRDYEVPVYINGKLTSINLKIVNDSEESGKINVSFETEETGKVKAEFALKNEDVTGFIVSENSDFEKVMKSKEEDFRSEFNNTDVKLTSMFFTNSNRVNIKGNYSDNTGSDGPTTKQLYSVAKAIIKAIQE